MDRINWKQKLADWIRQYKYVACVVLLGLFLMCIPQRDGSDATVSVAAEIPDSDDIQQQLEQILGQIQGVGKVRVMLTMKAGEQTMYQVDSDSSASSESSSTREQTVLITDANRTEQGLVRQVIPPSYRGALIVCQGGDQATVRLAIVEAVEAVTGLSSDTITVLKMK